MPSRRWERGTITGDDEGALDRVVDELEQQRVKSIRTVDEWGVGEQRMVSLCQRFPTLRTADGTDPWNPDRLLRWLLTSGAPTGGSRHAAKFVLSVWNTSTDWGAYARQPVSEGGLGLVDVEFEAFNVVHAMGVWDDEHQAAFMAWCELPFWP